MFARSSLLLTLFALPFLANPSFADAKKIGWDPVRTTSPEDVKELKLLQERVKSVVDKVTPATVAVLLGPGAGSGVIVSEDGLVLTAAHVIEPIVFRTGVGIASEFGKTVRIVLPGDIVVNGTILGRNPRIDSGMVKITDPEGIKPFAVGKVATNSVSRFSQVNLVYPFLHLGFTESVEALF